MNGSDLMNLLIAGGKGAAKVGEEVADAYQIMATNSFSQNPDALYYYRDNMKEIEKGQKMLQRDTMAMVSVQHVDTAYNNFYNNTELGKSLAENAQDKFKPGGKYTNWVETRAHQATIFTVGGVAGPVGAGFLAGMAAKGKTAETMWVNNDVKSLIDNGADIDALDDIYKKADTYSSIIGAYTGVSMAFQKATGSGGKIDRIFDNPIKRILGDGVVGSTEPIVNAWAESKVTGANYEEIFNRNGGWKAVGAAGSGAAFDSMVGEIKGYVKGRVTQEMKTAVKDAVDDLIHPKDRIVADPGAFEILDNLGNSIRNLFNRKDEVDENIEKLKGFEGLDKNALKPLREQIRADIESGVLRPESFAEIDDNTFIQLFNARHPDSIDIDGCRSLQDGTQVAEYFKDAKGYVSSLVVFEDENGNTLRYKDGSVVNLSSQMNGIPTEDILGCYQYLDAEQKNVFISLLANAKNYSDSDTKTLRAYSHILGPVLTAESRQSDVNFTGAVFKGEDGVAVGPDGEMIDFDDYMVRGYIKSLRKCS